MRYGANAIALRSTTDFVEKVLIISTKRCLLKQLRTSLQRSPKGFLAPPSTNLLVIAGEKHLRDAMSSKFFWSGELGSIQQKVCKRIIRHRSLIPQYARHEAYNCVHHYQRGKFTACEDVISD